MKITLCVYSSLKYSLKFFEKNTHLLLNFYIKHYFDQEEQKRREEEEAEAKAKKEAKKAAALAKKQAKLGKQQQVFHQLYCYAACKKASSV